MVVVRWFVDWCLVSAVGLLFSVSVRGLVPALRWLLFVVGWWSLLRCSLFVVRCALFVAGHFLMIVSCLVLVARCCVFVACWLVSVVIRRV